MNHNGIIIAYMHVIVVRSIYYKFTNLRFQQVYCILRSLQNVVAVNILVMIIFITNISCSQIINLIFFLNQRDVYLNHVQVCAKIYLIFAIHLSICIQIQIDLCIYTQVYIHRYRTKLHTKLYNLANCRAWYVAWYLHTKLYNHGFYRFLTNIYLFGQSVIKIILLLH